MCENSRNRRRRYSSINDGLFRAHFPRSSLGLNTKSSPQADLLSRMSEIRACQSDSPLLGGEEDKENSLARFVKCNDEDYLDDEMNFTRATSLIPHTCSTPKRIDNGMAEVASSEKSGIFQENEYKDPSSRGNDPVAFEELSPLMERLGRTVEKSRTLDGKIAKISQEIRRFLRDGKENLNRLDSVADVDRYSGKFKC